MDTMKKSIMRFTFEETIIINYLLQKPDKYYFISELIKYEKNTDNETLKSSLYSLLKKIEILSQEDIFTLYKDRVEYRTTSYPQYTLELR